MTSLDWTFGTWQWPRPYRPPRRGKVVGEQPHGQTGASSRGVLTAGTCSLPAEHPFCWKSEPKAGSDSTRGRAPRWPSRWWQQESAFHTPGDSGISVRVGSTWSQEVFPQEIPPADPHPAQTSQMSPFHNKTIIIIITIAIRIWRGDTIQSTALGNWRSLVQDKTKGVLGKVASWQNLCPL